MAVTLTAGCGSTVQMSSSVTNAQTNQGGQGLAGTTGAIPESGQSTATGTAGGLSAGTAGSQPGTGAGSSTGTSGSGGGNGGAGTGTSGQPSLPGSASGGAVPRSGPGWDATRVYLGFPTQNDARTAAQGLGLKNLDFGDFEGNIRAVLKDVNARGGLLGRQVVPVFRDISSATVLTNPSSAGQQLCSYFSQDRRVAAVVNALVLVDAVDTFRACMAKAKIPVIAAGGIGDDKSYRDLAGYLYTSAPSWNSYARLLVQRLDAQGFFNGWDAAAGKPTNGAAKVGVLIFGGSPTSERVGQQIVSALKAAGKNVVATFTYTDISGSQMSNAALQFRGRGVTHVFDYTAVVRSFMNTADQQQYRPRYSLVSSMGPRDQIAGQVPEDQLTGAMGVGYCPLCEVPGAKDPNDSPGAAPCRNVLAKSAIRYDGEDKRTALTVAYLFCDGIRQLVQGFQAGGGLLAGNLARGLTLVGSKVPPALTFRSKLSAARPYVAAAARDFAWSTQCGCFVYSGTSYAFPS